MVGLAAPLYVGHTCSNKNCNTLTLARFFLTLCALDIDSILLYTLAGMVRRSHTAPFIAHYSSTMASWLHFPLWLHALALVGPLLHTHTQCLRFNAHTGWFSQDNYLQHWTTYTLANSSPHRHASHCMLHAICNTKTNPMYFHRPTRRTCRCVFYFTRSNVAPCSKGFSSLNKAETCP